MIVEIGNAHGKIALYLDKQQAIDLALLCGPGDRASEELMWAVERAYPEPRALDNPCIHEPARCNGGGYDGCACGPYPKEGLK